MSEMSSAGVAHVDVGGLHDWINHGGSKRRVEGTPA